MNFQPFSIQATGTGNQQYQLTTFPIVGIIWYGGSYGSNPNVVQRTFFGATNASTSRGAASYGDSTGRATDRDTTYDIILQNRVSGSVVRVFEGETVSFDNLGGGNYGLTINQNTNSVSPTLYGVAFG